MNWLWWESQRWWVSWCLVAWAACFTLRWLASSLILPPLRRWLSSQMKYMAQRNPGSGRSLKFVALAGNSCGSSRSEAGSRSKPVTTSAPTSRASRSTVPPACTDGRCCHDETLKTHFESICSPSPSSFVLLEPGSRLVDILRFFSSFFCLSPQGLTVNRVKKPLMEWWENVAFFTHCDCYFQHFENTFNGYSKEWKSWRKGPLSGYFDKEPSLLTFNQLQTEPEWL